MEKICNEIFDKLKSRFEAIVLKEEEFHDDVIEVLKSRIQAINEQTKRLELVPIRDILYIDRDDKFALIITECAEYKQFLTFEMVKDLVKDFNFEVSDRKILVNMKKVKKFDSENGKVYFSENVTKDTIHTYLSSRNAPKFINQIGKENDLATDVLYTKQVATNVNKGKKSLLSFL